MLGGYMLHVYSGLSKGPHAPVGLGRRRIRPHAVEAKVSLLIIARLPPVHEPGSTGVATPALRPWDTLIPESKGRSRSVSHVLVAIGVVVSVRACRRALRPAWGGRSSGRASEDCVAGGRNRCERAMSQSCASERASGANEDVASKRRLIRSA
jgi:hypothetical protein